MFSKTHLLKLALISVAAIAVGALVGLALNYQTLKEIREGPQSLPDNLSLLEGGKEKKPQEKIATYSGKIKPSLEPEVASHYLEDDGGNMIIFLKSGKIDSGFLGLLEGQTVEVVGAVKESSDGQKILEVNEVHL